MYCSYLVFQLFSHKRLYDDKNAHRPETIEYAPHSIPSSLDGSQRISGLATTNKEVGSHKATRTSDDEQGEQTPELSLLVTLILLVVVTVLIGVTAEGLVHSIDGLASRGSISKEFIGLILLPIVGNAPECFTAVTVSIKDKLTSSLVATVGSSIVSPFPPPRLSRLPHATCSTPLQQTSLLVIPFIVILGWIIDRPITMLFDPLECVALFFSALIVNYVVQDGRSNWLEGMILICLCVCSLLGFPSLSFSGLTYAVLTHRYIVIALIFYFYPGTPLDGLLRVCPA